MRRENQEQVEIMEAEFKHSVFASNPELYEKMWGQEHEVPTEDEVQWVVPQTEGDVDEAMADLRALGLL